MGRLCNWNAMPKGIKGVWSPLHRAGVGLSPGHPAGMWELETTQKVKLTPARVGTTSLSFHLLFEVLCLKSFYPLQNCEILLSEIKYWLKS